MPSSHSVQTFTGFPRLPYELRRLVYLLCVGPRIVFIPSPSYEEEEEAHDQFLTNFSSQFTLPPLHPDVVYFANGWRHRAQHLSFRQRPLESFGFTTTKPPSKPWEPSTETPEIPLHALHEEPDLAFALSRSVELRSSAEIPPFLHVCPESRQTLISYGYSLAFGNRSNPPKVWFHFGHDTLYLEAMRGYFAEAMSNLCNTHWNLSHFPPLDLSRLRNVALAHPVFIDTTDDDMYAKLRDVFELLPCLQELTIATYDLYVVEECFSAQQTHIDSARISRDLCSTKNLTSIPAIDLDAFMYRPWADYYRDRSLRHEMLNYYRSREKQDVALFYANQIHQFSSRFGILQTAPYGASSAGQHSTRVPAAVNFSFICPSAAVPLILAERRRCSDQLYQMRRNYWACVDKHLLSNSARTGYIPYKNHVESNWAKLIHGLGQEEALFPVRELHYYATVENDELLTQIAPLEQDAENV